MRLTSPLKYQDGTTQSTATHTFRTVHTYAVMGAFSTATVVPSFFFSKTSGQVTNIISVRAKLTAGTASVQITKGGVNQGSAVSVTTTATTTDITDILLADLDEIDITITAATGATNLSFTLILEHVV
jgi:hypothetical protein